MEETERETEMDWIRPPAAAQFVREHYGVPLTEKQLQAWCASGQLKREGVPVMHVGNRYYIDREAIAAWIERLIAEARDK